MQSPLIPESQISVPCQMVELFKETNGILTPLLLKACLPQPSGAHSAPQYDAHEPV